MEKKNGTETEIGCKNRKQLRLVAFSHWNLERGQDWFPQATEGLKFC